MARVFMKGCEAIAEAAVRAGCRFFAGYPITPQNEIPEYFARRMSEVGGVFVQGESEVASVNMVYGAASMGTRSMTSSSSPGISLKSEGISYCASARIPMVYANISRGGPGVGSIQPAQQDYFQATKASGNGGFEMLVFAPSTVQEAVDMTYKAFDYADRDRNPVLILADGVIGTMMEPVVLPDAKSDEEVAAMKEAKKDWACVGHKLDYPNRAWIEPGHWQTSDMQRANEEAAAVYASWENEVQVEEYKIEDAEIVIAAYGISARISKSVVDMLRKEGIKVGLIRPITVHPFPYKTFDNINYGICKAVLDVEMSIPAQFVQDVSIGVKERCPIETCLSSGGNIISREAIIEAVKKINEKQGV
ncbi:3-methyl-2-oxobutanoate dehydrogenase subunit VorB [Parasporobacterium paucivorans]|uniref:2-oxoglutarate ferredoxin oxidoreductase subunit alpha n=1 Tax=Parasporobacterium paucivorans DSM 15970 TaxID=1122934 RepID=A0A1M6EJF5_9FIRM|nr:3-methyl-2-oxobutanoate dehydrogenase subunit VorB [Parasporobacterium paucivorans]SHI85593.1 2-oxoglutarate ferredoxin oxidoreductase subunit alpha [Parasporobacterium paucivorans DSM 15970]